MSKKINRLYYNTETDHIDAIHTIWNRDQVFDGNSAPPGYVYVYRTLDGIHHMTAQQARKYLSPLMDIKVSVIDRE